MKIWKDLPDKSTPIMAEDLNRFEVGLDEVASNKLANATTQGEVNLLKPRVLAQEFKIKNEIVNGDFSNGETEWVNLNSSLTVSVKIGNSIGDGTLQYPQTAQQLSSTNIGNIIYSRVIVKSNNIDKIIGIHLGGLNFGTRYASKLSGFEQFETLSGNYKIVTGGQTLRIYHQYQDNTKANGSSISIKDVLTINLTKTFGSGNEPTKEEMDILISQIGWFDGELTLTQEQLNAWQLALIREKANKKQEEWITPTLLNGATGNLRYRFNQFGDLQFKGNITSITTSTPFTKLVLGITLPVELELNIVSDTNKIGKLTLFQNGDLYTRSASLNNEKLNFNNITLNGVK